MISKAIFDSGVFIGAKLDGDQYNRPSSEILENFMHGNISRVFITPYIVAECVNFLLKKSGFQKANEALVYLTEADNIEIIDMDLKYLKTIFQKYKILSIGDCSLVALAEKLKIKEIFSFDRNFDSVKGITRLTSL